MRFPRILPLCAWFVLSAVPLHAQSTSANINGLVSDSSTAAIGGAEVVAVSDVTGVQYVTKTNSEGIYVLPNLPAGPYRLQVSKVGFKTVIKPDIVLNVQDALSINFTLPVGAAYEVLTVEGGAPLVNTESAAVSTVVDHTYVENMPLNGRSFQDLILLTPGTVTQTPQPSNTGFSGIGQTGEFSVNGQRPESNYYTVDGVSANVGAAAGGNMTQAAGASGSLPGATALGTTQALVSVDDLQEFRVQSSTYSAEYGRNPGGQFAFQTKSGTNQWHGTAYDYLRNGVLDAPDYFTDYLRPLNPTLTNPAIRQNDFGGTLGGPIRIPRLYDGKDKTFVFVSYEGLRLTSPQPASVSFVPDLCVRGESARCTGTNAAAPPALQPVLNAFPVPTPGGIDDAANGFAQYVAAWSNPGSLNSTSVRFDHAIASQLKIFFRFSDTGSSSATRGTYAQSLTPAMNQTSVYTLRTYTAGLSGFLAPGLGNDFRLNYSSNNTTSNSVTSGFGGGEPLDLQQLLGLGSDATGVVFLSYNGYSTLILDTLSAGAQKQWNLVDTLSLSVGHHQLKFGVDYRRLAPVAIQSSPSVSYYYFDKASVEENNAFTSTQANAPAYPLYKNFSLFTQDEWRVSQRLNLSLGLRWELNPAPRVTQGLRPYAIQGSSPNTWALAPQGTPLWQTTWFNFAPRLGAAYILSSTPGEETVLRGGGGLFFDTGQQLGSSGFYGPGFIAFSSNFASILPFPVLPAIPVPTNPPAAPYNSNPSVFATHLQLPYTLQWNVSIERALGKSQAITSSYVGSHGSRLLKQTYVNTPTNPNASQFGFVDNGLTSDYDSLQFQFRRRLSDGFTALASYTWAHCIDYGSAELLLCLSAREL